jgi:hypothetical protein
VIKVDGKIIAKVLRLSLAADYIEGVTRGLTLVTAPRSLQHVTAAKWTMHNSPLFQVTPTNPCEAWHANLKAGARLSKRQGAKHGLYGMAMNTVQAGRDVDNRGKTAANNFRHRVLAAIQSQAVPRD